FKAAATTDSKTALDAASGLADPIARDAAIAGVLASGRVPNNQMADLLEHLTLPKRAEATYEALGKMPMKSDQQFDEATRMDRETAARTRGLGTLPCGEACQMNPFHQSVPAIFFRKCLSANARYCSQSKGSTSCDPVRA